MWPFGKKKDVANGGTASGVTDGESGQQDAAAAPAETTAAASAPAPSEASAPLTGSAPGSDAAAASGYDPINGDFGPFDGDNVDFQEFDYSDFAKSGLDLGSLRVPVPHNGEVQVEMGKNGPQMIHILTPFGRLTPVAMAAPRSGNQWEDSIPDITKGMTGDGLEVTVGSSLWGPEVLGTVKNGAMRVIGVDGPRWMLRMTLAGPVDKSEQLAELAYQVISRTFVYRGTDPLPAGQTLPVTIPAAMAEELKKLVEQRQKDAAAKKAEDGQASTESATTTPPQAPQQTQSPTPQQPRRGATADEQLGDEK
ncbi:MAG TPA: DUF3710 domain-containing protein [Candidatus Corynebacterium avicola]|uniref:DUF3710 domain-containing protein n=1 Tax=Candidatus Corynebacterium avicola TaxID=2838527 RepID=A0A9D1ULD4_9CORY|nr:DUF3710 domain-containing protein [Candidatus Corynebacterium avicola]